MNPYRAQSGIALMPWSLRGILAGAYQGGFDGGSIIVRKDKIGLVPGLYHGEHVFQVAERYRGGVEAWKKPAQIALAWLLNKLEIVSPVVAYQDLSNSMN